LSYPIQREFDCFMRDCWFKALCIWIVNFCWFLLMVLIQELLCLLLNVADLNFSHSCYIVLLFSFLRYLVLICIIQVDCSDVGHSFNEVWEMNISRCVIPIILHCPVCVCVCICDLMSAYTDLSCFDDCFWFINCFV